MEVTYLDGKTEVLDYALYTATTDYKAEGISKGDTYYIAPNTTASATGVKTKLTTKDTPITAGLYSYTLNADGKITLSSLLTSTGTNATTATLATGSVVVKQGSAAVKDASDKVIGYATKDTALVLTKNGTVSTYTGYANFPKTATYTVDSGKVTIVTVSTGTTTKTYSNILVIGETAKTDSTPDSFAVYVGTGDNTNAGQHYNFYVNGEIKSYLLSDENTIDLSKVSAKTVYGLTTDKDGKAVLTESTSYAATGDITAKTDSYIATAKAVYYVKDAYTAYDIEAADATTWTDTDVEIGDTVTVIYKNDATAGVNNILTVFVTKNATV